MKPIECLSSLHITVILSIYCPFTDTYLSSNSFINPLTPDFSFHTCTPEWPSVIKNY
jgi:hypothetical protein